MIWRHYFGREPFIPLRPSATHSLLQLRCSVCRDRNPTTRRAHTPPQQTPLAHHQGHLPRDLTLGIPISPESHVLPLRLLPNLLLPCRAARADGPTSVHGEDRVPSRARRWSHGGQRQTCKGSARGAGEMEGGPAGGQGAGGVAGNGRSVWKLGYVCGWDEEDGS
jgi:hypothetical protein